MPLDFDSLIPQHGAQSPPTSAPEFSGPNLSFDHLIPDKTPPKQLAPQSPLMREFKDLPSGVTQGLMDVPAGGAQLLTGGLNSDVNQYIQNREQGLPNTPAFNVGRGLGNAVAGLPLAALMPGAAAEGLGARLLSGAASGALTGAMQPAQPGDNFWNQKAEQTGFGALGGAGGALATGALARTISGATNPDLKVVGGTPTPGQIAGGISNDIEQKLTSIPGVGDMIKNRRRDAIEGMNRTAINRALGNIGESLDKTTPIGRAAIDEMHGKIGSAYDTLLPQLTWQADPQFVQGVTGIRNNAALPQAQEDQFTKILQTQFGKVSATGGLTGDKFKEIDSEIGRLASGYMHDPSQDQRNLGQALKGVQVEMRSALTRANPQHAGELNNINAAYADALRVEGAAANQGAKGGIFSPAQLSGSVRKLDPSLRKGAFARGEARMQDLSDASQAILGNTVPDSGTPGRALMAMTLAGLGGEHIPYGRHITLPLIGANIAGMGLYSKPGNWLAAQTLMNRPQVAEPLSNLVRKIAPLASAGGGGVLANYGTQQ